MLYCAFAIAREDAENGDRERSCGGNAGAGPRREGFFGGMRGRGPRREVLMTRAAPYVTHEVLIQVRPLPNSDVADSPALTEALQRESADGGDGGRELHDLGERAGSAATQEAARLAHEHPPVLRTHDSRGNRIDEVEFHPAWHELMAVAVGHGMHAAPWGGRTPRGHVARAAKFYVWTQAEAGHGCPISMTYASVPALRHAPGLADRFEPLLGSCSYDPALRAAGR